MDLQAAKKHDADNRDLGLVVHLQGPDTRDRNTQDYDVVHHVHDSQDKKEELHLDTLALLADILCPEEPDRLTSKRHCNPENERVYCCQECCDVEHDCVGATLVNTEREKTAVEKEDARFDRCHSQGINKRLCIDDL